MDTAGIIQKRVWDKAISRVGWIANRRGIMAGAAIFLRRNMVAGFANGIPVIVAGCTATG